MSALRRLRRPQALLFLVLYFALSNLLWASSDIAVYIPLEVKGRCLSSLEPGPLIQNSPEGESAEKVAKRECGRVAKRCLVRSSSSDNKNIVLAKVNTTCGESGSITVYDIGFGETPAEAQENAKKLILSSLNPPWVKQKKLFNVELMEYKGASNLITPRVVELVCGNTVTDFRPNAVFINNEIVKLDWIGANSDLKISTSAETLIKGQASYQNQSATNRLRNDDTILLTVKGRDISYGGLKAALSSVGCATSVKNLSEEEKHFSYVQSFFLQMKEKAMKAMKDKCKKNAKECKNNSNYRSSGVRN